MQGGRRKEQRAKKKGKESGKEHIADGMTQEGQQS